MKIDTQPSTNNSNPNKSELEILLFYLAIFHNFSQTLSEKTKFRKLISNQKLKQPASLATSTIPESINRQLRAKAGNK